MYNKLIKEQQKKEETVQDFYNKEQLKEVVKENTTTDKDAELESGVFIESSFNKDKGK